jgi:hypothetical protein
VAADFIRLARNKPMKPSHWLPPLVAIIAGTAWLAGITSSKQSLAARNSLLRERIQAANVSEAHPPAPSAAEPRKLSGQTSRTGKLSSKNLYEWNTLAESILLEKSGRSTVQLMEMRLSARLSKMSIEDLLSTYDEIAASDMPRSSIKLLTNEFFQAASEKDPAQTLRHFESLLAAGDYSSANLITPAFYRWFSQEPATAMAWFDEMIAAGKLDSKRLDGENQLLTDLSGYLIESQLASDPAAALERLKSLEEDQQMEVFRCKFQNLAPGTEQAFGEMIRRGLPANLRDNAFRIMTTRLATNLGFAKAGGFLDAIGATPDERLKLAADTALTGFESISKKYQSITPQNVQAMREWIAQQAPQDVERISGEVLAHSAKYIGPEKPAAMVAELHAKSGSDELLATFLRNGEMKRYLPEEAMAMAAKIKDAALRERLIDQLKLIPPIERR